MDSDKTYFFRDYDTEKMPPLYVLYKCLLTALGFTVTNLFFLLPNVGVANPISVLL